MSERPKKEPKHAPELVARLSERVYRARLGEKDAASMVAKDGDDGTKLRRRAMIYAPLVTDVLDALAQEAGHD